MRLKEHEISSYSAQGDLLSWFQIALFQSASRRLENQELILFIREQTHQQLKFKPKNKK